MSQKLLGWVSSVRARFSGASGTRGAERAGTFADQAAYRRSSRDLIVLGDAADGREVAVGLVWRTIMLAGERQAAVMAKEARATHFCLVPGEQAVGYGRMPEAKARITHFLRPKSTAAREVTPLAILALRRFGSAAALLALDLGRDRYWLCSLRGGRPTGAEEVLYSREQLLDLLRRTWGESGAVRSEAVVLCTDLAELQNGVGVQPCSLRELLRQPSSPADQLRLVGRTASNRSASMSARLALIGVLAGYAGYSYYTQYQEEQAALKRAAQRAAAPKPLDSVELWGRELAKFSAGRNVPAVASLSRLRESVGAVPQDWLGWGLRSVACTARTTEEASAASEAPPGSANHMQVWNCEARYESGVPSAGSAVGSMSAGMRSRPATFAQLEQAVPAGFTAAFEPITKASLHWSVGVRTQALDLKSLASVSRVNVQIGSALQDIGPALMERPVFSFAAVPDLAAPHNEQGAPVAVPSTVVLPVQASLALRGPLRSIKTIIDHGIAADWTSLTITASAPGQDAPGAAALATSAVLTPIANPSGLTFELKGILYAKN